MGTQDFEGPKRRRERHAPLPKAGNPGSQTPRKNLHQLPFLSPVWHWKSCSHFILQQSGDNSCRDGETNMGLITIRAWQTAPGKKEAHRHTANVQTISSSVLAFPPIQKTWKDLHNHLCCALPSAALEHRASVCFPQPGIGVPYEATIELARKKMRNLKEISSLAHLPKGVAFNPGWFLMPWRMMQILHKRQVRSLLSQIPPHFSVQNIKIKPAASGLS